MINRDKYPVLAKIDDYGDFRALPAKDLDALADEIRAYIIALSEQKSIHLGSNLGIIETTIGLSRAFDLDEDIVFYDTGHQAYVHKIITGRKDLLHTIRDTDGLSGMQSMKESPYDYYAGGHAGNSLSIAAGYLERVKYEQGLLVSRWTSTLDNLIRLENKPRKVKKLNRIKKRLKATPKLVVPIIGDSALANGMALEALNDISFRKMRPIIVINDNGMSISQAVGSIPEMISKIKTNRLVGWIEKGLYKMLWNTEPGKSAYRFIYRAFHGIGKRVSGSNLFTALGYQYIGPIDGHKIKDVIVAADKAKWYQRFQPVVLHVKTQKSRGLKGHEADKVGAYHASSVGDGGEKLTGEYLAEHLSAWVALNEKIKVINPAMTFNSGFLNFAKVNPGNYYDVGICEEHAISFASGMAIKELKPFVVVYSSFLQRAYDQLLHDFARLNLGVTLLVDRAEISGGDGDSHHGIFDVGFLKTFPNTVIYAPSNVAEAKLLIDHAMETDGKIVAIRYPKKLPYVQLNEAQAEAFKRLVAAGTWKTYETSEGNDRVVVTYGNWVNVFLDAIREKGAKVDVVHAVRVNGYDPREIEKIARRYTHICVFEEVYGPVGLANEFLSQTDPSRNKVTAKHFARFPGAGKNKDIYARNGMDPAKTLEEFIASSF